MSNDPFLALDLSLIDTRSSNQWNVTLYTIPNLVSCLSRTGPNDIVEKKNSNLFKHTTEICIRQMSFKIQKNILFENAEELLKLQLTIRL